jgi:hypothetical protein
MAIRDHLYFSFKKLSGRQAVTAHQTNRQQAKRTGCYDQEFKAAMSDIRQQKTRRATQA